MGYNSFIDTAILAEQTSQNAARLRDSALQTLARKANWRISQTTPPDFELLLDIDTAPVPLLNILVPLDPGHDDAQAVRVQLPADKADPYAISRLVVHVCLDGPLTAVRYSDTNACEDFLAYDNVTGELKGRIDL